MSLKQPVGQKLLTNIIVVKLKKQGKKFELACYPNKVTDWRNKQEDNISAVMQVDQIYTDVANGTVASKNDLKKFGKMNRDQIISEILNKGEFQMSEVERGDKLENISQEIASWISQQCVNRETGNQFPSSIILRGMNEINCKVVLNKAAKQQGLAIIQDLKSVLPIDRARMHIKVTFISASQSEAFLKQLQEGYADQHTADFERQLDSGAVEAYLTIEKNLYRVVQDTIKKDA